MAMLDTTDMRTTYVTGLPHMGPRACRDLDVCLHAAKPLLLEVLVY